jgi:hypothetical protein
MPTIPATQTTQSGTRFTENPLLAVEPSLARILRDFPPWRTDLREPLEEEHLDPTVLRSLTGWDRDGDVLVFSHNNRPSRHDYIRVFDPNNVQNQSCTPTIPLSKLESSLVENERQEINN